MENQNDAVMEPLPSPEDVPAEKGKNRRWILWGCSGLFIVCMLIVAGGVYSYNRVRNLIPAASQSSTDVSTTEQPVVSAESAYCGRSDQQIILLLAYDQQVEPPYGSDGVRLLRVDYASGQVSLLALPRGLWVVAPQQVQPDLKAAGLGEMYQYGLAHGGTNLDSARTSAALLVSQALTENFDLSANNFIVMRLDTFAQILDSLGGIDITLPQSYTLNGQTYPAGPQHWGGSTTLQFVRALPQDQNDWDRFSRQDLVLQAIRSSSLASSAATHLPELMVQFKTGITTDLDAASIASLSCLLAQTGAGQVTVQSLPPDMVTPGPGTYLIPDYDAIKAYLQAWEQGK
jgi:polyisoprenyl-teichoic acid--peptidoglycan teichoic acid transferase